MKQLGAGKFQPVRRCIAEIDGRTYYGEVFNDQQRIFVDPEHPSLRPRAQYVYRWVGMQTGTGSAVNVVFF